MPMDVATLMVGSIVLGLDPNLADSDGDGILDNVDPEPGTDAQCTMPLGGLYKGSVKEGKAT